MSDPTRELIELIKNNEKNGNPIKASQINKLLREGADINGIDGEFPLFYGVKNGNYTVCKYLIEKGADVNQIYTHNNTNITSLHLACYKNNMRVAKLLIQNGANLNAQDNDDNTPLLIATMNNNVELVKTLLDAEPSASASAAPSAIVYSTLDEHNNLGYTPLNIACEKGNRELIELFVSRGADLSHAMNDGYKAIHQLCQKERRDLIAYLIDEGANVNEQNELNGITPLLIATKNGDDRTLRVLLSHDADPTISSNLGVLPIHNVASSGSSPSLLRLVKAVKKMEDNTAGVFNVSNYINARDGDGLTPLYIACLNEHVEMVRELVKHGADPNIGDYNDTRPLDVLFAITGFGNRELYRLILGAGADPNYMSSEDGHSLIVHAVWQGDPIIMKMLIDAGANVNRVDIDGNTPLMIACGVHGDHQPDIDIIKTLLEANVDMNIRSADGETALEILTRLHPDVAKELRRYKTAMVSYFLDPNHPRPMMSQIDAESIENIRDYMGGKRKSKYRQTNKRRRQVIKRHKTSKRYHK